MIELGIDAVLVKVCSMGLKKVHLGGRISDLRDHFNKLNKEFGFNVCGEGGEYETAVLDCPLFKK
jgi:diphthine-ammonia ligase